MEKQLTHREAWRDFYEYIKSPERWALLTDAERRRIKDAERDYNEERKNKEGRTLRLGYERTKNILSQHAPGRYRAVEGFILIEQ